MSSNKRSSAAATRPPPPPPPPPPPLPKERGSKPVSAFATKLKTAPPGYFFQPERPPAHKNLFAAPTGPYFFYGTLADPAMLRDILGLKTKPHFQPATITGYECKLWGPYPALLDAPGKVVNGVVYNVETVEHGERLASYETNSYRADRCLISYADGSDDDLGYVFKFVGNPRDLSDGTFDLKTWLKRMKRETKDQPHVK